MTTTAWLPRLFSAKRLVCLSLFLVLAAQSQWIPEGPPNVLDYRFMTTGGITYFRLVGLLPGGWCCKRIAGYDVSRQGAALNQTIQQEIWGDACIALYCDPWREELVSVLGALPPGNYSLTLWAELWVLSPWATLPFTVPTNSTPTLTFSPATNSPLSLLHVAGVSNVVYVLEASANLTDWTTLKTNLGAPTSFSVAMTNEPQQFYRASIRPAPSQRLF